MALRGRALFLLVVGALMILIASWIAIRPLVGQPHPITGTRVLDLAFALFFAVRGAMNVRTALRASRAAAAPPAPPAPPAR